MPIWPAAGLAVACCYKFGAATIPGLWLGTFLANSLVLGSSWLLAAMIGILNSLAPFLTVRITRYISKKDSPFETISSYIAFIFFTVLLHPVLTAIGGIGSQYILGLVDGSKFYGAWLGWWFAHATGTILFAPVILTYFFHNQLPESENKSEYGMVFILTVIFATGIFISMNPFPFGLPYLLIIPMAYVGIRFPMFRTMLLFSVIILIGLSGIIIGPYHKAGNFTVLIPFRIMAIAYSLLLILLSILRNLFLTTEKQKETLHRQYQRLAENSPAIIYQFKMSADGKLSFPYINRTLEKVLSLKSEDVKNDADLLLNKIHPDDREKNNELVLQSAQNLKPYHNIFRHELDDRIIWLEAHSTPEKQADGSIIWDGLLLDITERKIAQENFQTATDELETYFESALDLFCIASTDGKFIRLNQAWENTLGYKVEDLENKFFLDLVHPEDVDATIDAVKQLEEQKNIISFINRYRHKDGSYRYIEWRSKPQGKIIFAAARDITEKLAAEEMLKINKERLELAMNAANSGLWDWDIENDKVYFDSRYYRMAGYEPDEFPHAFIEWEKRVHPDDLLNCKKIIGEYLSGIGESFTFEFRFLRKSGDWMWIRGHGKAAARNKEGKILRMVGTHADITDRRFAEERLRESHNRLQTVMNSINNLIYISDMQTHEILFINQHGLNAWGNNLIGQKCYKALQNLDYPCPFCTNEKLIDEKGQPAEAYHWEFQNRANSRWYDIIDRAIEWIDGRIVRMEVALDITQRKQIEQLLAAKNKELEQLVYVASHDLRSPLVNVDGYSRELEFSINEINEAFKECRAANCEICNKIAPSLAEMTDSLKHVRNSTRQMDNLLKGLLKLSRLGRAALNIQPVEMNRLIEEVISAHQFEAEKNKIKIEKAGLPGCLGDPMQLTQVFTNLLGNAIKYMDTDRPGTIIITGKVMAGESIYCVEDNGIGISPQHQENIFQIFHRLNPGQTEGEGLGLTIVKQSLGLINGKIEVESEPGKGSRFIVKLPFANADNN